MDSRRKVRKPRMKSSSSSDDSSSSSTDSDERRKNAKKYRGGKKQRDSSSDSSSDNDMKRKSHKHQHKKVSRKHSHSSKMRTKMLAATAKKELISPSRAGHKHHLKDKLVKKVKALDEHERHPVRRDEITEHRITSPTTRIRVSIPNNRAIQERSRHKDSPTVPRRHVREASDEHMRGHYHKEKVGRFQEEDDHYKYPLKVDAERMPRAQITPDRHHHQHEHRSQSHGRIPKREDYDLMRGEPSSARRPPENIPPERSSYEYGDDRRMPDYNEGSSRMYEERGRRPIEPHPRSRGFDQGTSNWDSPHPHEKKRPMYDSRPPDSSYNPKWSKDKGIPDWKQSDVWKGNKMTPTMSHPPRRWLGPSDSWRSPHLSKLDSPGFKPRGGAPYFGQKRFPFKRFPSQYSKINFPSQRVLPSASEISGNNDDNKDIVKSSSSPSNEPLESGEIPSMPIEEEKMTQQPDTTFSGNIEQQEECEEGNLSEFSDVDDDDILNREEVGSVFSFTLF